MNTSFDDVSTKPQSETICEHCDKGLEPILLDEDGVRSWLSGKPGSLCHAYEDAWWPCPRAAQLVAALQEKEELKALLNTAEVEDFDKALPLEAGHQVLRWGTEGDAGKSPSDWFWLIGYLAGKALTACLAGNGVKAKHHCISTAAALRNWHAHIRTGETSMRPGIEPPQTATYPSIQCKCVSGHFWFQIIAPSNEPNNLTNCPSCGAPIIEFYWAGHREIENSTTKQRP